MNLNMNRVMSLEQLAAGQSVSMKNRLPMKPSHVEEQIQVLDKWVFNEHTGSLVREYEFADYAKAIAFVDIIGAVANEQKHYPDLRVSHTFHVHVTFTTHLISGVSMNDFYCAAKIDTQYKG